MDNLEHQCKEIAKHYEDNVMGCSPEDDPYGYRDKFLEGFKYAVQLAAVKGRIAQLEGKLVDVEINKMLEIYNEERNRLSQCKKTT